MSGTNELSRMMNDKGLTELDEAKTAKLMKDDRKGVEMNLAVNCEPRSHVQ